ncbi:uncharacterized protein DFL_005314 [Arthrobotrys flagrans]|uniref:Uncharacterized protein n=1 Tax=Arthrobotrys flagrans TaxID=97331 RepID=A0A437A7S1_ARTFL|nr:hypothetical protein DFL_005314 [Arthrobotrys flagrans]
MLTSPITPFPAASLPPFLLFQITQLAQNNATNHPEALLSHQPSPLYAIHVGAENIIPDKVEILKLSSRPLFHAPLGVNVTEGDLKFPQVAVTQVEITKMMFVKLVTALKTEKNEEVAVLRRDSDRQEANFHSLLARTPGAVGNFISFMKKSQRIESRIEAFNSVIVI